MNRLKPVTDTSDDAQYAWHDWHIWGECICARTPVPTPWRKMLQTRCAAVGLVLALARIYGEGCCQRAGDANKDVFIRWAQFGAFSPVMNQFGQSNKVRHSPLLDTFPFWIRRRDLAEKFPSELWIPPSEFGTMVENSQYRKSDGSI